MLEPLGIETGPIIPNAQGESLSAKRQLDLNGARVGVLNGISERLLHDPVSLVVYERLISTRVNTPNDSDRRPNAIQDGWR